jgi:hypothetical protein
MSQSVQKAQQAIIYMKAPDRQFLAEQASARGISRASLVRMSLRHFCATYPVKGNQDKVA